MNTDTFRSIEESLSISSADSDGSSSLERWYQRVRDTPLAEFSDEDLCKACRQELYPKWVVPHAISRLKANPLLGERYEGELIVALDSIPNDFWREHPQLASELRSILNSLALGEMYENVSAAIHALQERLCG